MSRTRRAQIGWLVASATVLVVAILAAGFSVTSCSGANGSQQDACAPTTVDYVADAVIIALGILVAAWCARKAWRAGRDSAPASGQSSTVARGSLVGLADPPIGSSVTAKPLTPSKPEGGAGLRQ